MKRKRRTRPRNIAWYKKKLWRIFTKFIKERDQWTCYTCGTVATGWGMGGGHFISKGACPPSLYFSEDNVHAQCTNCNLKLEGNHYVYGIKLGKKLADKLIKQRLELQGEIWSIEDYQSKIKEYEDKYKKQQQISLDRGRSLRESSQRAGQNIIASHTDDIATR